MTATILEVGIVGGSIAGCAMAIELARRGHAVTVFERTGEELKDRGAGIGVPAAEVDTFIARDLLDRDIPRIAADSFMRICRTPAAPRFGYLAWDQPARITALNWGGLYRELRKRVADAAYRTRQQVIRITTQAEDHAVITLADGTEHKFDLVICADGYNSLGRRTLFPDVAVNYAGYVLWRGFMDEADLDESPPLESGIRCVGYAGGHGIFYFVPGADGALAAPHRLVNWGMYMPLPADELDRFLTDRNGLKHDGSLPPGSMPLTTETHLKTRARTLLPEYYAQITDKSSGTFAYAIYDCEVPAYRRGRICLAGDAGAFARPHSGAGAQKGIHDAIALGSALDKHGSVEDALAAWDRDRTTTNNGLVRFGNQLGHAFVETIPDWSTMDAAAMESWFNEAVTIKSNYILGSQRAEQE